MKPINFKQSRYSVQKPKQVNDKGETFIHVYVETDGTKVSLWTCSIWQRLKFLFHGKIWLYILCDELPPVSLECKKNVFIKENIKT